MADVFKAEYVGKRFVVDMQRGTTLFYGLVVGESRDPDTSWVLFQDGEYFECSHEDIRRSRLTQAQVPAEIRVVLLGLHALAVSSH